MAQPEGPLGFLLPALGDLSRWLAESAYPNAVIGGLAAGLQGRPRITKDIDAAFLASFDDAPR